MGHKLRSFRDDSLKTGSPAGSVGRSCGLTARWKWEYPSRSSMHSAMRLSADLNP